MSTVLLVLRTVFLLFIVGYTVLTAPAAVWGDATATVTIEALRRLHRAAWIAIAWIALETAAGWVAYRFRRSRERPAAPAAGGAAAPQP